MFYDVHIPRCAHIKTNGTQCGSPALCEQRLCFFHEKWQRQQITLKTKQPAGQTIDQTPGQAANQTNEQTGFTMPLLEDADSVQVALMPGAPPFPFLAGGRSFQSVLIPLSQLEFRMPRPLRFLQRAGTTPSGTTAVQAPDLETKSLPNPRSLETSPASSNL